MVLKMPLCIQLNIVLEWRAGVAGHLILSDEDLTSVVQGSWKRLNTLQHYKVIERKQKLFFLNNHS